MKEQDTPHLEHPPLVEVVCGFIFEGSTNLSTLDLGVYADQRAIEYPLQQLRPALSGEFGLNGAFSLNFGGVSPVRVWLISAKEDRLIQLQHDRMFFNWRARGEAYPRFSKIEGVKDVALGELKKFNAFIENRSQKPMLAIRPIKHLEITKINMIKKGVHWKSTEDLLDLLPILKPHWDSASSANTSKVDLQIIREIGRMKLIEKISSTSMSGGELDCILLESRAVVDMEVPTDNSDELGVMLSSMNEFLNNWFFGLIRPEHLARFGGEI